MSRLLLTSDLHLGHRNICKYREGFSSLEEHNEVLFDNLASNVSKRDTLYMLGDIAFDKYWLEKVKNINCSHKKLICGNHDRDFHTMKELCDAFDSVDCLLSKRNVWLSHCPIHPQEIRGRGHMIHGHTHSNLVKWEVRDEWDGDYWEENDPRYINVCVEHTDYKPITFQDAVERVNGI